MAYPYSGGMTRDPVVPPRMPPPLLAEIDAMREDADRSTAVRKLLAIGLAVAAWQRAGLVGTCPCCERSV